VDADGKFAANSFPAGEYFVCVVRDDSATDWLDPARIEVFSRSAQVSSSATAGARTVRCSDEGGRAALLALALARLDRSGRRPIADAAAAAGASGSGPAAA
jgi:hypothetical protein